MQSLKDTAYTVREGKKATVRFLSNLETCPLSRSCCRRGVAYAQVKTSIPDLVHATVLSLMHHKHF